MRHGSRKLRSQEHEPVRLKAGGWLCISYLGDLGG